jgi:hypothetical protein
MSSNKTLLDIDEPVIGRDESYTLAVVAKALRVVAVRLYKLARLLEKLSSVSFECFRTCRTPFACGSLNLCDTYFLKTGGLTWHAMTN